MADLSGVYDPYQDYIDSVDDITYGGDDTSEAAIRTSPAPFGSALKSPTISKPTLTSRLKGASFNRAPSPTTGPKCRSCGDAGRDPCAFRACCEAQTKQCACPAGWEKNCTGSPASETGAQISRSITGQSNAIQHTVGGASNAVQQAAGGTSNTIQQGLGSAGKGATDFLNNTGKNFGNFITDATRSSGNLLGGKGPFGIPWIMLVGGGVLVFLLMKKR